MVLIQVKLYVLVTDVGDLCVQGHQHLNICWLFGLVIE